MTTKCHCSTLLTDNIEELIKIAEADTTQYDQELMDMIHRRAWRSGNSLISMFALENGFIVEKVYLVRSTKKENYVKFVMLRSAATITRWIEYCGWISGAVKYVPNEYNLNWDRSGMNPTTQCINTNFLNTIEELKYINFDSVYGTIEMVKNALAHPDMEILQKLGFKSAEKGERIYKKMQDRSFRKYLYKLSETDKNHFLYNYTQLMFGFKNDIYECLIPRFELNDKLKVLIKKYNISEKMSKKIYSYIWDRYKEDSYFFRSYEDYMECCAALKLDFERDKVSIPHDFEYWHNLYVNMKIEEEAKENENALSIFKDIDFCMQSKDFYFVFPKANAELVEEGKANENCVGRMGYFKKMLEKKCLICLVREERDKTLYTMELDPSFKIKQLYARANHPVSQEVREKVESFLPKMKKQLKGYFTNA